MKNNVNNAVKDLPRARLVQSVAFKAAAKVEKNIPFISNDVPAFLAELDEAESRRRRVSCVVK